MRKRNCDKLFDNIFWYTIYMLPILITIAIYFSIYHDTGTIPSLVELAELLIDDGSRPSPDIFMGYLAPIVMNFFPDGGNGLVTVLLIYCGHFILANIVHLFVDFILFIPRLCHKWMDAFTRAED